MRIWATGLILFLSTFTVFADDPIRSFAPHFVPPYTPDAPAPLPILEKKAPKIWSGDFELGINGASGNSEVFNGRFGGKLKRFTPDNTTTIDWSYRYATSAGLESENRATISGKSEWPILESPWSAFVSGSALYDEFKAFDVRLAAHAGIGYEWLNNGTTLLKTRLGAGASREIGGPENAVSPEALAGVEFEHKITERQKVVFSAEYFPNVTDFSDFRTVSKLSYQILTDPLWGITFKTGVSHQHDSTPQGRRPNDIEYFATILWSF